MRKQLLLFTAAGVRMLNPRALKSLVIWLASDSQIRPLSVKHHYSLFFLIFFMPTFFFFKFTKSTFLNNIQQALSFSRELLFLLGLD